MSKYLVGFWYTEYGKTYIEAASPEEAEQKLYNELEENGVDDLQFETTDRDYGTQDAELASE